ncbi:MAG TPA: peptidylprolyl isomerase [Flavobacteriaceae bacterium]|nr:peptidylprolyl isomerase [Flavobacteriaceae bacterium]
MQNLKYFLFISFFVISCKNKKEEQTSPQKKITKEIIQQVVVPPKKQTIVKKDSLTNKNTTAFFTEYGKQNIETVVEFSTRIGNFTVKLYKDTPIHRANFIFLAKSGYFDTTSFHRLVPNFVAQFGNSDNIKTANFRNKYKQYKLQPEFRKKHKHKRGALAAARDWELNPNKLSTPFEFYIVQSKKGEHHLNFEHTVFGSVIKGMHTIDKIIVEKTDIDEWPFKDVNLKVVKISK